VHQDSARFVSFKANDQRAPDTAVVACASEVLERRDELRLGCFDSIIGKLPIEFECRERATREIKHLSFMDGHPASSMTKINGGLRNAGCLLQIEEKSAPP
jgi:hypothetical protein